jgi:hypothetical protein
VILRKLFGGAHVHHQQIRLLVDEPFCQIFGGNMITLIFLLAAFAFAAAF